MFLVLTLIASALSFYCVLLSIRGVFTTKTKGFPNEDKASKRDNKVADLGILGTLRVAWNFKGVLWDDIPPYERTAGLHEKHGSIIRMFYNWGMTQHVLLVADLGLTKEIFRSSAWLNRTLDEQNHYVHMLSFNKPLGILFGNDQHWREARRIVVRLLREHKLLDQTYLEDIYSAELRPLIADLFSRLNDSGCAILSTERLFDEPIMNVVFKFLFGRRLNQNDPKEDVLLEQMHYNNAQFTACLSSIEYFPFMKHFPQMTFMGPALKLFHTIYDIVAEEAQRRKKGGTYNSDPQDILDSMMKEVDEHEGKDPNYFSFEAMQVTMRDLLLAAGHTTKVALQHMILYMAMNVDMQEKVQKEIDQVIGPERWPSYDDKANMVYTQAVLLETLRFGSTTPLSARTCNREYRVGDLTLAKGTHVVPNYFAIHRSKDLWEDPDVFRPDRFISDTRQIVNTDKIIPFASGPRACPGELGGRVALFMYTVTLLREFKWELSDRHPPPVMKNLKGLTRPPPPHFVKLRRRDGRSFEETGK